MPTSRLCKCRSSSTLVDLPSDPDWVFTYDTSAAQNQKGRLAAASNGVITTGLAWTLRGEIATETTTVDGEDYAVSYDYDAAGNQTVVQTPSGVTATTQYAGLRPKTVTVSAGTSTETIRELAFLPFGPRTRAEFPPYDGTTGTNTVVSTREYTLRSQVSEIDVTGPMGAVLDRSCTWHYTAGTPGPVDPGPNLDRVIDHRDASESRFYGYDELDRLCVHGRHFLRTKRTPGFAHLPSGSSLFASGRRGSIPRRPDGLHPAFRLAAVARSSARSR